MMKKVNKPNSLYIHIPFCAHICKYCDFTKLFYFKKYEKPYLEALKKEILSYKINNVKTLYFGGGTPTVLSDEGFEDITSFASKYLDSDYEFTVEANVENLTLNKLRIMKKYGVNRLSIGVESTSNKILKEIGRHHNWEDAQKAVELAKKEGFDNINIDLIYGFKGETLTQLKKDLENFIKLDIDHISIYSLIVEKGSILYEQGAKPQLEEDSRDFYEVILKCLRKYRYERYEVSNFARNKKYSKHNLTYWRNEQYYGCGLGASGYVGDLRYTNTRSMPEYLKGNIVYIEEKVTNQLFLTYYLITNLRLEQGFDREDFKTNFGIDFLDKYQSKIKQFKLDKYFNITKEKISLTDEGILLMDFVVLKLL